jgi:AmmeMemoRadiSam system protein B
MMARVTTMVDARRPAAAGTFYPGESDLLARAVRDLLHAATRPEAGDTPIARAIVAPHGALAASGLVAAAAWASVQRGADRVKRVVLVGPAHGMPFTGAAAPFADAFATPLGVLAVDRLAIEAARRFPQLALSDLPHANEHTIEVHLPFVQVVLGTPAIVPLVVGEASDEDLAQLIDALWTGDDTLLVVSTDLSRYYDAESARALDETTAQAIERLDAAAIEAEHACAPGLLRAAVKLAAARGMRATRLDVRQYSAAEEGAAEVIGFGAFAIG